MDFGNPKELRFFNDLRLIPGSEAFGRGGEGGHIVTDFVTHVMRTKNLLKKSGRYIYIYISGRFFQKVTDRWADHRNQLLVRTRTLKCLAKPNPAAIPSNDLLLSKNPANEPILVNCTNEVIENESKLPVWTTATLTRLHKWYLISSPWTPIAPQMRPSNLTASGSCNFKDKKDS